MTKVGREMQVTQKRQVTGAEAFKLLDKNNDGRLDKEDWGNTFELWSAVVEIGMLVPIYRCDI